MSSAQKTSKNRLYETIGGILDVPVASVDEQSSPETLPRWDSLNHLNLAVAIETEFGISLSPQDVIDMRTVGLIQTILREYGVDIQ